MSPALIQEKTVELSSLPREVRKLRNRRKEERTEAKMAPRTEGTMTHRRYSRRSTPFLKNQFTKFS